MTTLALSAPEASEYNPYYGKYISLIAEGDILATLTHQIDRMKSLLSGLGKEEANYRYAPDKWTIRQALGHVIDAERVFAYRALRISRNDKTPLAGFEQNNYVPNGPFEFVSLPDLLEEYAAVRRATVLLFRHLRPEAWLRRGVASNSEVTVRALAYIIAGHSEHHYRIFQENYAIGKPVGQS
jgi:DinB superfamily